ncbi:putative Zn-dependent peptidase [Rhodobacter aestuarii]|uniref:Predicted Zn-dependent peptidase n=1 Tax=Rhodobacter aestuarii TaxID=453582 RepID=A0A1N7JDT9_9RHOB|nr:insulinase family protein [Rhodobacter aestuarii]PTV96894.1 putative Zn-dependent peptidase [Rhodobacter aestuarii]SIS47475.1 Predicted Zn-dependent peptidase [Rhodobacter aestuarii]
MIKWACGILALVIPFLGAIYFFGAMAGSSSAVKFVAHNNESGQVHFLIVYPQHRPILAHYTEHLAWLPNIGKNSRPEDRGSNAWTNDFAVGYWLSGPPEDLTDMLRRLQVVFDPIDLPQELAETERDVMLREYDWRMANNPDTQAAEEMEAFLYKGNAIAASVIGTPDQIKALTYDAARAFHAETHRPELARLVVTGDVTERQLAKAMAEAGFPTLDADREYIAPPPFTLAAPEARIFRYPAPNAAARMTWRKVVALPEPVDFDLLEAQTALARDILDTNLPGGLAGPLRFDAFVTKSFGVSIAPIDETHIELIFSAEPDKGIGFAAMQTAFEAALFASAQGVPAATYDRVHERFKGFWPDWSDEDETERWMADYTLSRVSALREPKTERQMRKIDAQIDAADIDTILAALVAPGRTAIAFIGTDPNL